MSREKQLRREFWRQEKRFERAKDNVWKYINLADAWKIIMNDAISEQHKINKELGRYGQEDEP